MIKKTWTILAAAVCLAACGKNGPEAPEPPTLSDYVGTVTVTYQESDYDNPGIKVRVEPSEDGKTVSLTLFAIKFVPQMPVTIDVTVPSVTLTEAGAGWTLSCDEMVPLAMGGEYPRYRVTGLSGTLSEGNLSFALLFGDYPTSFKGALLRE